MDLTDANQSCDNTEDVKNVGESPEKELASNNVPLEISDKIDSQIIAEDEKASASHRQQNGYFKNETESCEIVANVWHSFNAFQRAIVDIHKKDKLPDDASYDRTSVIERSPTSCTSGNLSADTSEPGIQVIAENNDKDVKDTRIISTRALPTTESSTSGSTINPKCENWPFSNAGFHKLEMHCDIFKEDDDWDIYQPAKCENWPFSNAGFHKLEMHCDIFKEDDDWDIYQPGVVTTEPITIESSLESQFSFERLMLKNAKYMSKNNSKSSVDYDSCQRVSPCVARGTSYSPSNNSVNNGSTFPEWNEERMLKEVKEYFLNNPVQVSGNLSYLESMKCIITAPYFSKDFALRYDLPLPTLTPIQDINLLEDTSCISRILTAYEMIGKLGISEDDFFRYISMDNHRLTGTSPWKLYTDCGLDPSTIENLDLIQEKVGPETFYTIYKHTSCISRILAAYQMIGKLGISEEDFFRYISMDNHRLTDTSPWKLYTDCGLDPSTIEHLDIIQEKVGPETFYMISKHQELLNKTIQFWNGFGERTELLREKHTNIGDSFLSQNQADSTFDVISEDILVSQLNADFLNTTSRSHAIKTPGLNDSDSNSYADDGEVKALHKMLKTSPPSTDLSKVQSIKPNDSLGTELKCSPILQSTNQDNKAIRSSFDSFQGHSDKSNGSPDHASIMRPHIQNSVDQNDEEKSSKVDSVKSRNSLNNATHSSDQNFKENSRDVLSGKSHEVSENVSKVQPGVRKHISQDDDTKSRKKIHLQDNSNTGQPESKKEESPTKD